MQTSNRFNVIRKYAIIEAYPTILKHNNALVSIPLFLIYFIYSIFWLFKLFLKSSKKFLFLKNMFFRRKDMAIEGATSSMSFDLRTLMAILALNNNKSNVLKTEIKHLYGIKAKEKLRELYREGYCDLDSILKLGHFILREEIIFLKTPESLDSDIFVALEYNQPAVKTYELYRSFRGKIRKFCYNPFQIKSKGNE